MMVNSASFNDIERSGCFCERDTDSISLTLGSNSYDVLVGDHSV